MAKRPAFSGSARQMPPGHVVAAAAVFVVVSDVVAVVVAAAVSPSLKFVRAIPEGKVSVMIN